MGRDRTGVMVACYLICFNNLDPESALKELRKKRPRSLEEAPELESVIKEFYQAQAKKWTATPIPDY